MPSLLLNGHNIYDLIPLIENWFQGEGFKTSVLANKVEANKRLGIFSSLNVIVFLEDYPNYCVVKSSGSSEFCQKLNQYLLSLQPIGTKNSENKIVIKEREIVKIPCRYCGALIPVTENRCHNCGAIFKG